MLVLVVILYRNIKKTRRLQKLNADLKIKRVQISRLNTSLVNAIAEEEESNRKKNEFMANISHEIRTPLNAIVGFSNLLVENAGDNIELRDYANIIRTNSDSLMVLINNILSLGRIDSNRIVLSWQRANLMNIIDNALAPFQGKAVKSIVDSPSQNIEIVTDVMRLGNVFGNVYSNAFKFTKQGHVKTIVTLDDNNVYIRIEDTGIGVPDDKKELIFERFEKVDTFTPGSGLGLSICRELLKRMSGTIYCDKNYTDGLAIVIQFSKVPHQPDE